MRSVAALASALRGLARIEAADELNEHVRIVVRAADHRYRLNAVWVGHGWPSEVSSALATLGGSPPPEFVFAAKRFSPGAISTLEKHAANWADEAGQARIVLSPGLLVVREVMRSVEEVTPQTVRWSPSATEIAEFVLHKQIGRLHTGSLADQTGWSAAQVSKVLKMFDSLGWTERRGGKSGRATRRDVIAPGPLLDSWASHVGNQQRRRRLGHVATPDLLRFAHTRLENRLRGKGSKWALTTWAALEMTTPFVTAVPILHIYVSRESFATDVDEVMREAGIREVEEGARVEFWEADFRILVQEGELSGIPVISRPRLYADLLALGGRAAEAAVHYREAALGI